MRTMVEARLKRTRAVELAALGHSYEEIAQAVGFSHRGSADRAVSRALCAREVEAVDDLRRVELDRLDRLQATVWRRVADGDFDAISVVLRVIDRRIRIPRSPRE